MRIHSTVKFIDPAKAYLSKKQCREGVYFVWVSRTPIGYDDIGPIGAKAPILIHLN